MPMNSPFTSRNSNGFDGAMDDPYSTGMRLELEIKGQVTQDCQNGNRDQEDDGGILVIGIPGPPQDQCHR